MKLTWWVLALAVLATGANVGAQGASDKTLSPDTRFYVPPPPDAAVQQVFQLLKSGNPKDAGLISMMVLTPQGVVLHSDDPKGTLSTIKQTLQLASLEHAVPVFDLYGIPGANCSGYGPDTGTVTTAQYEAWIDLIAQTTGNNKAVIILERGSLANLPSDCGYDPTVVDIPQATADRYAQLNYAINALESKPRILVYLDAGHSHWKPVGDIAQRLATAGVQRTQGFFTNGGLYQYTDYETKYDTWVSECIAFANNPDDGGWRLGHYNYCASQYWSPYGWVDPNNINTWIYSDWWYLYNMGSAVPTTHFVIDTGHNGQGPFDAGSYAWPPYNQAWWVIQTLNNANWCNPPARGVGLRPTANTGVPLLDAYVWMTDPGKSNSVCNSANGLRAWDYSIYTQAGWPTTTSGQAAFDPLWGMNDPAYDAWFPQEALDLAQRANPPFSIH
jgi:endoglucanase